MSAIEPIRYFERPDCPGRFFVCDKLSATLTTTACEKRWRTANDKHRRHDPCDPLQRCKGCAVGAEHAGSQIVACSPIYGQRMCSRCQRPSARLIHDELCPSCYNRAREYRIGRNAKGTRPINHPPLERRRILVGCNGAAQVIEFPNTIDMTEAIVSVLRHENGPVVFGFKSRTTWVQLKLL